MRRRLAQLAVVSVALLVPCRAAAAADTAGHLFVIERNVNSNVVAYDAVTEGPGRLSAASPLRVYWLMNAVHGQVCALNALEWLKAYGYDVRSCDGRACTVALRALKSRLMTIRFVDGEPRAVTAIGSEQGILRRVFVTVDRAGLFPAVRSVELFGESLATAAPLYERLRLR